MALELEVKEALEIPEGKHSAKITHVELRTEPFEYVDVYFQLKKPDIEIKYGCPANLSSNSRLGKLLKIFGANLKAGSKMDIEKFLVVSSFSSRITM